MDEQQIEEIELGIKNGVDVTIYAKKEFSPYQMWHIRKGLEQGLDVSSYAKPGFDADKMSQIRRELGGVLVVVDWEERTTSWREKPGARLKIWGEKE